MKIVYFTRNAVATAIACMAPLAIAQRLPTEDVANATALNQIGAPAAWARGYTGLGVKIGFVDTGADLTHKDLANVRLSATPFAATISDATNGHGTGMISMAAGANNGTGVKGVAYNATVMAYAGGTGGGLSKNAIASGIAWNANNGATAINLSLGLQLPTSSFGAYYASVAPGVFYRKSSTIIDPYRDTALMPSLQYATAQGSIVVMAAGNDGNPVPTSPANLAVATNASGQLLLGGRAVIVGAVDDYGRIASFSNRAGHICQTMVKGVCSDKIQIKDYFLVAPGGSFVWGASANTGSISASMGTSASTAFVTGGVAVIKQAWPTLRPEQIVQVLLKTATDLGAKGVDEIYGNGLMNLDAATKPLGALTLAKITSVSTTSIVAGPVPVSTTGMTGGVITKQSFENSAVLSNAQAVDEVGRNYTIDTRQGIVNSLQNFNPITAYSGLSSGQINSVEFTAADVQTSVFTSNNLAGVKVGKLVSERAFVGVEIGSAIERNSLLGTQGSGAFALGDSTTEWVALHTSAAVTPTTKLFASYSHGSTNANAAADSLITNFSTINTSSWSLGLQKQQVLSQRDAISFSVTELPHVTSGTASLAGVTGFTTANVTEEGAESTPEVTRETVNLRSDYRQYVANATYTFNINSLKQLNFSLSAQTDNAGTEPATNASINFTSRF
ncbi:Autotransporter serine protease peptidase domain [uncultured Caudovirales phage]|uniref:Autotransporter serine protease peptidase domain n=1 Tax=uncultured Caudovirales phage TaxID=2100421 RepID=A0A6J5LAT2_9CAUD|nr:Autotransporter serine protease peptidase domain [uncultured Caudovirales phage]